MNISEVDGQDSVVPTLTIVLTNFKRPRNIESIYSILQNQTIRPEIFVWDNNPGSEVMNLAVHIYVRCMKNLICLPRWHLAKLAQTKYVAIMDDDLLPKKVDTLEKLVRVLDTEKDVAAVGPTGVVLDKGKTYRHSKHISLLDTYHEDIEVSIIKGRFLITRTELLNDFEPSSLDCEDIEASAHLAQFGRLIVPAWAPQEFNNLNFGDYSLETRSDHYERREVMRRRIFG